MADLPAGWLESLLPRQTAAHDQDEPPAVRSYLGYLADRGDARRRARCARSTAADAGASVVHCAAGKDRTGVVVRARPGGRRRAARGDRRRLRA